MIIEVKVPSPGESVTQVQLAAWLVAEGDYIEKDTEIAEIDSDKATLSVSAEESGKIKLLIEEGDTIDVGSVMCRIDTSAKGTPKAAKKEASAVAAPKQEETPKPVEPAKQEVAEDKPDGVHISPLAKKLLEANNLGEQDLLDFYKKMRISKGDVVQFLDDRKNIQPVASGVVAGQSWGGTRDSDRKKMTVLRLKLSERLVKVKNETAMLTTFNEVNMTPIMDIRKKYKELFKEKFGVSLGFMSFFTKAVTVALQHNPQVNAMIDGNEMVYHNYADVGIAVSAPKGLMVPVIRNAETLALHEIEAEIKRLALKARDGKLTIDEMTGGTFTITNGGVFGSMMSTPILNPPQSAILGMHNIVERPIAVNGNVEIHPMMYVAMSYDHRIIDGRESVGFLVQVKEMLEAPEKMLFGGDDPMKVLLGILPDNVHID
jgi:2-oxoglutarate dehydrogenase E2 component (dihydrolipoamide succinyltransferase)